MTPKLREILNKYRNLLRDEDFNTLYYFLNDNLSVAGEFTQLLYNSGVNPLKYLKNSIPSGFLFGTNITSINIPNNIKFIKPDAFRCSMLESIDIPDTVISIGQEAFEDCLYLKSVKLPNKLTEIAVETFINCESLQNINIPQSVIKINYNAFKGCNNLKEVKLREGLQYIGASVFRDCTSLEKIEIPNSVKAIGYRAFANCTNLKVVQLGRGAKTLGNDLFYNNDTIAITYPGTFKDWEDEVTILDDTFAEVDVIIKCSDKTFEIDGR